MSSTKERTPGNKKTERIRLKGDDFEFCASEIPMWRCAEPSGYIPWSSKQLPERQIEIWEPLVQTWHRIHRNGWSQTEREYRDSPRGPPLFNGWDEEEDKQGDRGIDRVNQEISRKSWNYSSQVRSCIKRRVCLCHMLLRGHIPGERKISIGWSSVMGRPTGFSNIMEVFKDCMEMGVGVEVGRKPDWRQLRVRGEKIQTMNLENATWKLSLKVTPNLWLSGLRKHTLCFYYSIHSSEKEKKSRLSVHLSI